MEYDSSGNVKKKYIYALNRCIAYIDSAGGKYYLHHDALGSVRKITSSSGDSVCSYRYYPYGQALTQWESKTNDLKFTGKALIPGMAAYDFSARYYDPEIARFYGIDPMPSGGSPYAYCGNNPLAFIDPSGMAKQPTRPDYVESGFSGRESPYYTFSSGLGYASRSGGHLSNNGVWVSGLQDASGQNFNTWYSTFYNYALRGGFVGAAQNIAVIVNILSSDYFDNVGRYIQEAGIMIGFDKEYKSTGYVPLNDKTVIKLGSNIYLQDALMQDILTANPTGSNSGGILNMARTIGHEAIHTIQFGAGLTWDPYNLKQSYKYEFSARSFGNSISDLMGEPRLPSLPDPGW